MVHMATVFQNVADYTISVCRVIEIHMGRSASQLIPLWGHNLGSCCLPICNFIFAPYRINDSTAMQSDSVTLRYGFKV